MSKEEDKDKIFALINTLNATNIELAERLALSVGVDLKPFWGDLNYFLAICYGGDSYTEKVSKLNKLLLARSIKRMYMPTTVLEKLSLNPFFDQINYLLLNDIRCPAALAQQGETLFQKLDYLKNVRTLRCDAVAELPIFKHLPNVETVLIVFSSPHKIHDDLFKMPKLKALHLEGNAMAQLPDNISQATRLKNLIVAGAGISEIPDSIDHLEQLQHLDLASNAIVSLPQNLAKLKHLEWLRLTNNPLDWEQVLSVVEQLPNLRILCCFRFHRIRPSANKKIEEIDLSHYGTWTSTWTPNYSYRRVPYTPWEEVGETLVHFKSLKRLKLMDNSIEVLPQGFCKIPNLEALYLNHNRLSTLPDELFNLPLRSLSLASNQFEKLPEALARCKTLEVLNLCNNKLREIPDFIEDLPNLRVLNIHRNPLNAFPLFIKKIPKVIGMKRK